MLLPEKDMVLLLRRLGLYFVPCFLLILQQASRAQILDKATEYIQYMRRKNHTHQQDIDDLKRQNALLEQQGEQPHSWGNWPCCAQPEPEDHASEASSALLHGPSKLSVRAVLRKDQTSNEEMEELGS